LDGQPIRGLSVMLALCISSWSSVQSKQSLDSSYKAFCNLVIKAAKRSILPGPDKDTCLAGTNTANNFLDQFQRAPRDIKEQLAEELISCLNKKRRECWDEAVTSTSIDFTHSSRKARSLINCLTGRISQPKQIPITV